MAPTLRFPLEINNLKLAHQGKSRDTFKTKRDDLLAPWASNRLSTHDIVHKSLIARKGEVLTALTVFWLNQILGPQGIQHHLVAFGSKVYEYVPGSPRDYPPDFHLRTLIVQKKKPILREFVFRNCLEGSLFDKFHAKGVSNPYGVDIPQGMVRMDAFPNAIFTPTTKSDDGDVACMASEVREQYGPVVSAGERIVALATEYLRARGIELVDTKLEFDEDGTLIDEVLTPDSSRFTRIRDIVRGKSPVSLDKQIARDEAIALWGGDIQRPPLKFSYAVEQRLTATYLQCFEEVTGMSLGSFQGTYME